MNIPMYFDLAVVILGLVLVYYCTKPVKAGSRIAWSHLVLAAVLVIVALIRFKLSYSGFGIHF